MVRAKPSFHLHDIDTDGSAYWRGAECGGNERARQSGNEPRESPSGLDHRGPGFGGRGACPLQQPYALEITFMRAILRRAGFVSLRNFGRTNDEGIFCQTHGSQSDAGTASGTRVWRGWMVVSVCGEGT
jgi:hypothetical protein